MRVPLERRVKSWRVILVIALLGSLLGIGAMHARDIAQGRIVSLRFVRSLLADLVAEPSRPASDAAPTDEEDALPTPEQAAKQAPSAPDSKPATSSLLTDKTSPPASDTATALSDGVHSAIPGQSP